MKFHEISHLIVSQMNTMKRKIAVLLFGAAFCLAAFTSEAVAAAGQTGRVYVMTNKAHNSVLVYDRAADGSLTFLQQVMTRGSGTGVNLDPLQSQGSVAVSSDGKVLLGVNAGSGELTAIWVALVGVDVGSTAH